ncbi:MAG: serine hydrolase domain-containing protein [Woeseiaceae bacterium]
MNTRTAVSGKIVSVLATVVLVSSVALAQDDEEQIIPSTVDELLEAISDTLEEHDVPAVGMTLVDSTGPSWVGSLGKADIATDRNADADTIYRIGSTSKMFVALSVLQLVEEGRLSLDDKVADLVPEIEFENPWQDTAPIRVVHLLEHTTGWDDIHLPEYAHNDPAPATLKEGLDYHPHSRVSRWQPGTRTSYCNAGPPVAAYIIEKITGQDFERYVAENFFAPLQMNTASFRLSEGVMQNGATLYSNGIAEDYWHIVMRPSGAINASPNDMASLLQLFLGRGTVNGVQYVDPLSIERMERAETNNAGNSGLEAGYGLNNYTSTHENWVYRGHNGGVSGGLTEMAYLPEAEVGYAFMINADSGAAFGDISELIRNFQTRDLPKPDVPAAVALDNAAREIAGFYQPINPRQQIGQFLERMLGVERLWFDDDELQRKPLLGGEIEQYLHAGNGLYRSPESGMVVLARAEDPLAGAVVHVGSRVMQPVSAVIVYGQLAIAALWGLVIASSFLFFLIWGVRKLRGKIPAGPSMRVRVWPLLAGVSVVGFVLLFAAGMSSTTNTFQMLGAPTPTSIGVMLATIAFLLFAVLGVQAAVKHRGAEMNRLNYWYCSICSGTHLIVALYLVWFGVIGIQTWA